MNWVCDDAWRGPFTQSTSYVGSAIGTLFFGWLTDRKGRLPSFIVSNIVLMVGGVALPYCTDFYSFTAMRFVMGFVHNTYFLLTIYLLGNFLIGALN